MPPASAFPTAGDYDSVRLHEASHATGHSTRLNRDLSGEFGSPAYAKEELRAEISAAMTSRVMGVAFDPDQVKATEQSRVDGVTNSAAYLASWLRSLPEKDRTKELMSAISDAQKISDHLLSHVPELQVEQEHERPTVSRGRMTGEIWSAPSMVGMPFDQRYMPRTRVASPAAASSSTTPSRFFPVSSA